MTRRTFLQSTPDDIEGAIDAGKWRLAALYDVAAFQALATIRSYPKGEAIGLDTILGRDVLEWDERMKKVTPQKDITSPDAVRGLSMLKAAEQKRAQRARGAATPAPEKSEA